MNDPTRLIRSAAAGDVHAHDQIFRLLRPEMERIAEGLMRREPREVTVQAGVLISELYLKLRTVVESRAVGDAVEDPRHWESRKEFLRYASTAMKSILVDTARRRTAKKRGWGAVESVVSEEALGFDSPPELLLFLDEAIANRRKVDPAQAELLELVRFGGLSPRAAGGALQMSRRKTEEAWTHLRAWLAREWGLTAGRRAADEAGQ